jgi:heme exporter protein D
MKWSSADEFFAMGGYGLYVWGAYAVAAQLMVFEPPAVRARYRQALRDAASLPQRGSGADWR